MLTRTGAAFIAVLALGLSAPAWADFNQDVEHCTSDKPQTPPDIKIGACTRLIQSGQLDNNNLSIVFWNRGTGYNRKGQYDQAIRDFDETIRLKPDDAYAFNNRGNAYAGKGEYDRAIRDFDEAIRLKPDYARAFGNRGEAYEKLGRRDQALRNYKKLYELGSHPKWLIDKLREYGELP